MHTLISPRKSPLKYVGRLIVCHQYEYEKILDCIHTFSKHQLTFGAQDWKSAYKRLKKRMYSDILYGYQKHKAMYEKLVFA